MTISAFMGHEAQLPLEAVNGAAHKAHRNNGWNRIYILGEHYGHYKDGTLPHSQVTTTHLKIWALI